MVNAPDRTVFASWDGKEWVDQSWVLSPLINRTDLISDTVTTRDYPGDGILDFLISWDAEFPCRCTRSAAW